MKTVSFTEMEKGTKEDYEFLCARVEEYVQGLSDRVLAALDALKNAYDGYQISRYEHSLQTATRAYRNGESEEMVIAALLHDIGGGLAPYNHDEMAAAILKPYVSEKTYWIVKHHSVFQKYAWAHHMGGDRYEREKYRDHPYYQATIDFCHEYDQNSFDPDYKSLPLEFFEPMVRKIFSQPHSDYEFKQDSRA